MPEYAFVASVQQEIGQLTAELSAPDVSQGIDEVAQRLGISREVALAALWRASKRHGETLPVFLGELRTQHEREVARQVEGTAAAR